MHLTIGQRKKNLKPKNRWGWGQFDPPPSSRLLGLSNTYEIMPLLLKYIGEQDFVKKNCHGITCCHGNSIYDAMFSQIVTF